MGRTPHEFDSHGVKDVRRFLKSCTFPHPEPCPANDLFILPPVYRSKSHENRALAAQLEEWRTLENTRPLEVADTYIQDWLDRYAKFVPEKPKPVPVPQNEDNSNNTNASQTVTGIPVNPSNTNASQTVTRIPVNPSNSNASQTVTRMPVNSRFRRQNPPQISNSTVNTMNAAQAAQNAPASQNINAAQNPNADAPNPVTKPEEQKPPKGPYKGNALPDNLSPQFYTQKSINLGVMENWIQQPIVTASRVMHLINEKEFDWTIDFNPERHNKNDFHLFRNFRLPNIVVAYQSPYVLARQEMHEFVECKSFPQLFNPKKRLPLQSKHRLWAKIWDACYDSNRHWFILTTYTQWVVGCFSPGWRIGFVSPIFHYDSSSPTLLEWLTYWFACAAGMPGTMKIPLVYEPIRHTTNIAMNIRGPNPGIGARSESYWGGADQEPGNEAVDTLSNSQWSDTGSYNSNAEPRPPFRIQVDMESPALKEWMKSVQLNHKEIDEDDLQCPFDIEAEWPDQVFFQVGREHGDWMVALES